ncbi:hypothetical protein ACLKA7_001769 [Drosophila subpalustris]
MSVTRALSTPSYCRGICSVYRLSAIRVSCAFRTISDEAALVIAGMIPITELIAESGKIHEAVLGAGETTSSISAIRADVRQNSIRLWQSQWDNTTKGRWTHQLIPKLSIWLERKHGERTPPPQAASQNRESPRRKSPTKQVAYEENATIKGTLKSMGTALDALSALFGGQRHITLSMRDELAKIIELQKLLTSLSSPILAAVEVQVTPSLEQRRGKTAGATGESSGVACTPKRMRESLPGPRKTPSKKPRRQGPFTKEAGVAVPHDKEDWTLVKSRQSMSKRSKPMQEPGTMRHLKPRPDAILIEAKASDHEPILFSIGSTDRRDRRQVYCGRAYKESTLNYQTFANVMGNLQVYGSAKQMSDQLAQHLKRVCEASMATSMVPIDLLAAEEKAVEAAITAGQEKKRARSEAKEASMTSWQQRWSTSSKGRWTHRLLPDRQQLSSMAGLDVTPDNLVDLMIERSEFWDATCNFAALIMQELRRVERERNR